jgi:hypothetical protein
MSGYFRGDKSFVVGDDPVLRAAISSMVAMSSICPGLKVNPQASAIAHLVEFRIGRRWKRRHSRRFVT